LSGYVSRGYAVLWHSLLKQPIFWPFKGNAVVSNRLNVPRNSFTEMRIKNGTRAGTACHMGKRTPERNVKYVLFLEKS